DEPPGRHDLGAGMPPLRTPLRDRRHPLRLRRRGASGRRPGFRRRPRLAALADRAVVHLGADLGDHAPAPPDAPPGLKPGPSAVPGPPIDDISRPTAARARPVLRGPICLAWERSSNPPLEPLSLSSQFCYTVAGRSDDRVATLAPFDPVPCFPLSPFPS